MTNDLIIDENNFNQYFFDVRTNKPQPGQVLACYEAQAEFVDGNLKRDLLHLLLYKNKAEPACRVFQKVACATWDDSVRICREITEDLISGMSSEEVLQKPYSFKLQQFFYTEKQYIPDNDPHWWSTSLIDIRLPEIPCENQADPS